jgi:hypothetical protein
MDRADREYHMGCRGERKKEEVRRSEPRVYRSVKWVTGIISLDQEPKLH